MTTEPKTRTITLTDASPVRIREDLWPVIAVGRWWEGQIQSQANRSGAIRVRQHADGRSIVYGSYTTAFQNEESRSGGKLLAADSNLVAAIRCVAEDVGIPEAAVRECIADLPAVDLDGPTAREEVAS